MFKICYKDLRSTSFLSAMHKVTTCEDFQNISNTMNVAKVAQQLEVELKKSQTEWIELATKFIKKTPENKFAMTDTGFDFIEGVDPEGAEKEIQKFLDKEVIVEAKKLKLTDLAPVKLSPAELNALMPIIAHMEAVG